MKMFLSYNRFEGRARHFRLRNVTAGQAVRAVPGWRTSGGQRTPMNRERAARPTHC
jgi:hypothetical protein